MLSLVEVITLYLSSRRHQMKLAGQASSLKQPPCLITDLVTSTLEHDGTRDASSD
jgi:hypothetical protein